MSVQAEAVETTIYLHPSYLRAKRVFDIVLVLAFSPFIVLVGIIIGLLIRLDSQGPVLFRQERVGLDGAEFCMLKFRTMYVDSDDSVHREASEKYIRGYTLNDSLTNPYKLTNDTRITRIGHFLRKTSLDELPQFWNVLRGEMSIVGPRPPLPYEVQLYTSYDQLRLSIKPGMTGLWQVHGRNQVPFREMVELDIQYLKYQSIVEDMKLILRTIPLVLLGRGA